MTASADMQSRSRWPLRLVIGLFLLLALGSAYWLWDSAGSDLGKGGTPAPVEDVHTSDTDRAQPGEAPKVATGVPSRRVPSAAMVQEGKRWRVRCLGPQGPVADATLAIALYYTEASQAHEKFRVQCDAAGVASFDSRAGLASLIARVDDDRWGGARTLSYRDFSWDESSGVFTADLELVPVFRLYFDVKYADDTPWEGSLELVSGGFRDSVHVVQGRCDVSRVPALALTCMANSARPGFAQAVRVIKPDEIIADAHFTLTLAQSKSPRGGLVVRVPDVGNRHGAEAAVNMNALIINAELGFVVKKGRLGTDPSKDSKTLRFASYDLKPGRYDITLRYEGNVFFRSVMVLPSEVCEVDAYDFEPGATVRVRVVDEAGVPVKGAVLHYADGTYISFPHRLATNGTEAMTDEKGHAALVGVSASEQRLLVEGEGFEVYPIDVSPLPGVALEMTCVLQRATVTMAITLTNAKPGNYKVSYRTPALVAAAYQNEGISGEGCYRTGPVPRRKYLIVVRGAQNGPIAQTLVDLTEAEGEVPVQVDVGKLVPIE